MKERNGLARLDTKYLVFKREDIAKYCTSEQIEVLSDIATRIDIMRAKEGKPQLYGVFIRSTWPEFEPVVHMLLGRIDREK